MSNRPSMLFAPFFRQPRPHSAFGTSRVAFAQICVMWYSTASSSRSEAIFHLGHFSCQEGRYEEAIRFSCTSALVTLLELLLSPVRISWVASFTNRAWWGEKCFCLTTRPSLPSERGHHAWLRWLTPLPLAATAAPSYWSPGAEDEMLCCGNLMSAPTPRGTSTHTASTQLPWTASDKWPTQLCLICSGLQSKSFTFPWKGCLLSYLRGCLCGRGKLSSESFFMGLYQAPWPTRRVGLPSRWPWEVWAKPSLLRHWRPELPLLSLLLLRGLCDISAFQTSKSPTTLREEGNLYPLPRSPASAAEGENTSASGPGGYLDHHGDVGVGDQKGDGAKEPRR